MLTTGATPRKVFNTIQILRGVAALIVVFFHLSLSNERRGNPPLFGGLFQHGFAGVDLFFVISGFVITHTSHQYFDTPSYFSTYLRKRFIRIYPIFWFTFFVIVGGVMFYEYYSGRSSGYLPETWFGYLSSFLLLPNHPDINGVTWSLSYELYYYVLFGLLILSRRYGLLSAVVLILSMVAVIFPNIFYQKSALLGFFLSPYNLEFALGVLVWWLIHRFPFSSMLNVGLVLLAGIWLLSHESALFEEPAKRFVIYGISSFLLVWGITGLERNGWFAPSPVNRLLMTIGDASYLIYIFHFPILYFFSKVLVRLPLDTLGQHIAAIGFATVITVVCIYLHKHLEAPLVKKLNRSLTPTSLTRV